MKNIYEYYVFPGVPENLHLTSEFLAELSIAVNTCKGVAVISWKKTVSGRAKISRYFIQISRYSNQFCLNLTLRYANWEELETNLQIAMVYFFTPVEGQEEVRGISFEILPKGNGLKSRKTWTGKLKV
jgi:hypothetical protein